jgi:kynurenine formamidase
VLIIENARTPASLIGRRVELLALPLPLVGADGSPIRLLARPIE